MYNSGSSTIDICVDKAIAQFTVEKLNYTELSEITLDEFNEEFHKRNDNSRKDKGFGSTDKK
jgi:dUTPase